MMENEKEQGASTLKRKQAEVSQANKQKKSTSEHKNKLVILTCGGTIAMSRSEQSGVGFNDSGFSTHLQKLETKQNNEIITEVIETKGSSEMGIFQVLKLANRITYWQKQIDIAGIIVTHGTDALEDTTFLLKLVLPNNLRCPIVLTAAMKSSNDPFYDGINNIQHALAWINQFPQLKQSHNTPSLITVVMNRQAHSALHVHKQHTSDISAFDKTNPEAYFDLIHYQWVLSNQPTQTASQTTTFIDQLPKLDLSKPIERIPRVEILTFYAGSESWFLQQCDTNQLDGLILVALGCGNVNEATLTTLKALKPHLPIIVCSRITEGPVFAEYSYPGGGKTLEQTGAILTNLFNPYQLRLLLTVMLMTGEIDLNHLKVLKQVP